jgi:hypothetical protein
MDDFLIGQSGGKRFKRGIWTRVIDGGRELKFLGAMRSLPSVNRCEPLQYQ